MPNSSTEEVQIYTRNSTPSAAALVRGIGVRVYDKTGKEYIDCSAQTLNLNLGQCHPEINDAVISQLQNLTFASSRFSSEAAERLAAKLIDITPPNLSRVNLKSTSGSSANESAVKAARKRTGKKIIFSILHSHHGQTMEMMRLSGKHFSRTYLGPRGAVFLPLPAHSSDGNSSTNEAELLLEDLETLWALHSGDVAAIIIEPVLVDAGVIAPSKQYLRSLRSFCTTRDVALIFDEVQTGFGWLGTLHAMDYFGVTPDIVTFGKALGAGFPLAATLVNEKYDVLEYGEHELTYGAHPASCAASLKMIEILQRADFLETVRSKSKIINENLVRLQNKFTLISEVRGVGFIWGIEIYSPAGERSEVAGDLVSRLLEDGLILRISKVGTHSNVLQFKPSLVIGEDDLDIVFSKLEAVLSRY